MSGAEDRTPDDDLLAAEHALGVLDAAGRRRAADRLAREPAFAARVAEWEARLTPMAAAIEPAEPSPGLFGAIETVLPRVPQPSTGAPSGRSPGAWRWFAIGSFGLAVASLAVLAVVVSRPVPQTPPLIALLSGGSGPALYTVVVDAAGNRATLVPVAVSADPDHAHELWLIGDGAPPRSLGLLGGQAIEIRMAPGMAEDGRGLAISLEPPGGSPTGLPTGPVVAQGALRRI